MKLGLGSAQFGSAYGISNTFGKPDLNEVQKIIDDAQLQKVEYLDTAPSYGDSESVIGKVLNRSSSFKIITKTPYFKTTENRKQQLKDSVHTSLEHLKLDKLYGCLVHNPEDLLQDSSHEIWEAFEDLKMEGILEKVGVSVYDPETFRAILDRYPIELLQFPLNVFDQRFIQSGALTLATKKNILCFARSVFLQGLLLMNPSELPSHLTHASAYLGQFQKDCDVVGMSHYEAALNFVLNQEGIEAPIIGVTQHQELRDLVNIYSNILPKKMPNFSELMSQNLSIIDPREWAKTVAAN